ncbi:MAG TPA: mechanosensitive ion channel domain-containing protein, partial [Longimicrobiales bacterium]|nr:mechanosensitive ion channel domain-containing protein [Longimicrobiales bacterium]
PLISMGGATLTIGETAGFVTVILASWLLAGILRGLTRRIFSAQSEEEEGALTVLEPLVFFGTLVIGILAGAGVLGLDWSFVQAAINARLFTISEAAVTPSTVAVFAVIVALSWGLSRLARRATARKLRVRQVDPGTVAITQRLIHYGIMAVGLAVGLDNLGVNLAALFAAGAVFAVGIGFAMQNIAQNFVSGLILLVERSIKPGDVVEVEGRVVAVSSMGIRSTVARTRDDEELIIPNSSLVQNTVKNYTFQDSLYRLRAPVGVEYGSDMNQVKQVLEATAKNLEWPIKAREPVVLLREFADSAVVFEVSVWMNDPWTAPRSLSQLNEAVWWALKDAGITIAFPQLDVHFDPVVEEAVESLPRAS